MVSPGYWCVGLANFFYAREIFSLETLQTLFLKNEHDF